MKKFFETTTLLCVFCLFTWLTVAFFLDFQPVDRVIVQTVKTSPKTEVKTFTEEPKKAVETEVDFLDAVLKDAQNDVNADADVLGTKTTPPKTTTGSSGGTTTPPPPPPVRVTPPPVAPPPVAPSSCPVSTQRCIPCTIGSHWACRAKVGQKTGYLGVSCQTNNPGNIRPAASKNTMIVNNGGVAPCGKVTMINNSGSVMGEYMVFRTYTEGFNGLKAYIKGINNGQHSSYTGCGNCTLTFFFSKYAPGDPNYDDAVAKEIGVTPSTTLSEVVNTKLDAFANAIKKHEGWYAY